MIIGKMPTSTMHKLNRLKQRHCVRWPRMNSMIQPPERWPQRVKCRNQFSAFSSECGFVLIFARNRNYSPHQPTADSDDTCNMAVWQCMCGSVFSHQKLCGRRIYIYIYIYSVWQLRIGCEHTKWNAEKKNNKTSQPKKTSEKKSSDLMRRPETRN